eukprot:COSAG05_NODE_24_length_31553_cov_12.138647_26_plen_105_part_00
MAKSARQKRPEWAANQPRSAPDPAEDSTRPTASPGADGVVRVLGASRGQEQPRADGEHLESPAGASVQSMPAPDPAEDSTRPTASPGADGVVRVSGVPSTIVTV